ncbi:MAG: LemA family protein [Saprospiraceae bacterium]|nr:LemA family protein [Saprospiraceae bacterium]
MTYFLIIIAIAALAVFYFVGVYNKFVRKRSMMDEGWSGIDVQLKKRYDLIPNLVETVKGYASHEKDTLQQVIEARNRAMKAEGVSEQNEAEKNLNTALANIYALGEAYPDLKANTNFLQLQQQLAAVESDVEKARRYYNATVRENNIMVESFPSNLIANAMGFEQTEFFEIEEVSQREAPQIKF